ncbi:MAG: replicative DNA helicase [Dehalococcoidia bacterium]|nr:replicative DNA helicase [Dehalococcoidia bacterium]
MMTNDLAADRLPPQDILAEQSVVGSILIDPERLDIVADIVRPDDFFYDKTRKIYEACLSLYERREAINIVTVARELEDRNRLDDVGGPSYLAAIVADTPTSMHAEYYAGIVHRTAMQRRIIAVGAQIAQIGYDAGPEIEKALDDVEELVFGLREQRVSKDFVHLRDALERVFEESVAVPVEQQEKNAIPTGFLDLDRLLGGLKRSDLILLAARPGLGKSSLALNIAYHAAAHPAVRATVAIFSLEMATDQLVQRMLASHVGIETSRLRLDLMNDDEQQRLMAAMSELADLNIYLDDTPMVRVSEIRSKARRLHARQPIDLIIVDYLQLIQGNKSGRGGENRVQELGDVSRSLKILARELNVPVLAVAQLSRAVETRSPHIPVLSDLRESGSLEQDADVVLFIYREDVYYSEKEWERKFPTKPYPKGIADIIVAKHRNGPTGQISLLFFGKTTRFVNLNAQR